MGDVTIQTGGLAYQQIFVSAEYGFTGTVSFACSGLPANATCTFSPTTVTPSTSATGIGATMLSVAATSSSSASLRRNSGPLVPSLRACGRALLLGLEEAAPLACIPDSVLSMAGLGLLTSCGGSSSSSNSYPITVVATSGTGSSALTHWTTFTLTIDK